MLKNKKWLNLWFDYDSNIVKSNRASLPVMPFPEESLRLSTLAPRLFSDQSPPSSAGLSVQGDLFLQNQEQTNSNQESEFLRFQQEQSFQQEALQTTQQEFIPQEEQFRRQEQFVDKSNTEER